MTLRVASRRLGLAGTSGSASTTLPTLPFSLGSSIQHRYKWSVFDGWQRLRGRGKNEADQDITASELDDPKKRQQYLSRSMQNNAEGSILQDEIETPESRQAMESESAPAGRRVQKTKENMAMVTDPDPRARVRWQRRKVIQMVRRNGQLTKEERIKMTERQLLHKSEFLPTSVKKLVMLARQIAGKPVDDAITQMQWSKKKMSAELKYYLEEARDLAIAQRGMGLGSVNGELLEKPRKIQTKDGKWLEITDPTRLYIAQSWVGRGPWRGKEIDYKGRGRMGIIQHPSTSFSVVLKEEKTRIREFEEREARKQAQGPWIHLPNRRVFGQRPYYSW